MTNEDTFKCLLCMRDYLGTASKAIEDAMSCADSADRKKAIFGLQVDVDDILESVCDKLKQVDIRNEHQ